MRDLLHDYLCMYPTGSVSVPTTCLLLLSFLPSQFLGALQHGVLHASLETMTCIAYSAPAGLVASMLVKRTQRFKYIIVVGWALLAAGMGSNVSFLPRQTTLAGPLHSDADGVDGELDYHASRQ